MALLSRLRCLAAFVGFAGLVGAAVSPARAHPHVWINVETTVLVEQGSIVGFRHKWTFDEFYTAMAIQGLDTNNDGIYAREELAELAKVNIEGLKEFKFFTHAKLAGTDLAVQEPKDFWLEHATAPKNADQASATPPAAPDASKPGALSRLGTAIFGSDKEKAAPSSEKVLSLHFTLPLQQPVLIDAPEFNFAVYNSSFFLAFELAKSDPIKITGAPANCRVVLGEATKEAADAQKLGEAFSQQLGTQNFGYSASRPIKIACGSK